MLDSVARARREDRVATVSSVDSHIQMLSALSGSELFEQAGASEIQEANHWIGRAIEVYGPINENGLFVGATRGQVLTSYRRLRALMESRDPELQAASFNSDEDDTEVVEGQVFLGMSFVSGRSDDVLDVIRSQCSSDGLTVVRVDEFRDSRPIIEDIQELIDQSEFLIFDLTDERPNVYYELGYADASWSPVDVLLVARKGTKIHFDTGHRRVNFYSDLDELERIVASMNEQWLAEEPGS